LWGVVSDGERGGLKMKGRGGLEVPFLVNSGSLEKTPDRAKNCKRGRKVFHRSLRRISQTLGNENEGRSEKRTRAPLLTVRGKCTRGIREGEEGSDERRAGCLERKGGKRSPGALALGRE